MLLHPQNLKHQLQSQFSFCYTTSVAECLVRPFISKTQAQWERLLAWKQCVHQAFHFSVWGGTYIRGKMQPTAHDWQGESIQCILRNKFMCNVNKIEICVPQGTWELLVFMGETCFPTEIHWQLLNYMLMVYWECSMSKICPQSWKLVGNMYAMMTILGGPACLRVDVNTAQVEELILDNHQVEFWEQLKNRQEI